MLSWDDTFAIARRLKEQHPEAVLESVSLEMIYLWVLDLPDFEDDRELANDQILEAIYLEWFEEANPL
jgi:FeS assembly protein IscX